MSKVEGLYGIVEGLYGIVEGLYGKVEGLYSVHISVNALVATFSRWNLKLFRLQSRFLAKKRNARRLFQAMRKMLQVAERPRRVLFYSINFGILDTSP